jgi:biotin-(acetyl-CoA carboxylase) ligase
VIRRHLASDLLGRHIYFFGPGSSPQAILRRLGEAGAQEGTVVLSEDGSSVHAAALFRPALALGAVQAFASITTLALAEAIEHMGLFATPVPPNRVAVDGDAVGTSLVEVAPAGDRTDFVILGMDVDVSVLEAAARRPTDPNAFVAAWLNALDRWSTAYAARGLAAVDRRCGAPAAKTGGRCSGGTECALAS